MLKPQVDTTVTKKFVLVYTISLILSMIPLVNNAAYGLYNSYDIYEQFPDPSDGNFGVSADTIKTHDSEGDAVIQGMANVSVGRNDFITRLGMTEIIKVTDKAAEIYP